jgi:predicted amino acid dehydrogenase
MALAETSAGRLPGSAETVAVLGAGGTMGFAIARRLG